MPSRQVKRWPLTISFPARHFHDDDDEAMMRRCTTTQLGLNLTLLFQNATWCVTDADINISGLSLRVPSFFPSKCVFGYSSNGYTRVSVPVSVCIPWSDCKQLPLTAWPVSNCAASLLAIVLLLATVIGFTQALPYRCHHYRCRLWVICPLPPLQTAVRWLVYREIN